MLERLTSDVVPELLDDYPELLETPRSLPLEYLPWQGVRCVCACVCVHVCVCGCGCVMYVYMYAYMHMHMYMHISL